MERIKRRTLEILQVGKDHDLASIAFDLFIAAVIALNLFVTLFVTFDISKPYLSLLRTIDLITMIKFGKILRDSVEIDL